MSPAWSDAIARAEAKCLAGEPLSQPEIERLLEIPLGSEADALLRRTARSVARTLTGNAAYIWSALGLDYSPCPMNCRFCSLGEAWGLIDQPKTYSDQEVVEQARYFVEQGARFIVIRTTEFYRQEALRALVGRLKREIPGDYEIILNIGEFDLDGAQALHASGVAGVYHALRLREGIDTPFPPEQRLHTIQSVQQSPLKLISLVEPVGAEHSNAELARAFLTTVRSGAEIGGAMARVPVPGTPLGGEPPLPASRLAQLIAVFRLSGGRVIQDICVHPASAEAVESGANVVVVEAGAIPRDPVRASDTWNAFTMDRAKELLENAGYVVYNKR